MRSFLMCALVKISEDTRFSEPDSAFISKAFVAAGCPWSCLPATCQDPFLRQQHDTRL